MSRLAIVIIGRNEGERLKLCIDSVLAMDFAGMEIDAVYVDSDSSDGSIALAQAAGLRTIELHASKLTAALARNAGWRATTGEFVLFLDGDTIVHPGFVASALPSFDDPRVAAVCGDRRERFPAATVFHRVCDLDWNAPPGPAEYCGGDALFRRHALEESGGYDPGLIGGEEPELCTRLRLNGWKIVRLAVPMTIHDLAMTTLHQYWRRAVRTGHAYAEVSARFHNTPMPLWSREAAHNRRQVFFFAGLFFLAALGSLALRALFPLEIALLLFLLLVFRTAWRARAKSPSTATLLLYGLHSHLQQLPIYLGQRRFYREARENAAKTS